jgi:hypothetical protein
MPTVRYTNDEIQTLVKEPKPVPGDAFSPVNWRSREGHDRADLDVEGENGNLFSVKLRRNQYNEKDFSLILCVEVPNSNVTFRLRRYNGYHTHRNKIENERFRDFHIHTATELYQERGFDEDGYAQVTDRYSSFATALRCLIEDCGFEPEAGSQQNLFSP